MYNFISYSVIMKYLPEIIHEKVSTKARSRNQFVDMYRKFGVKLPIEWLNKRNAFITRTYAAYKMKPTRRRYLILICWAFQP